MDTPEQERGGYGVGRVPADVDPALEALANAEAAAIVRRQIAAGRRTSGYPYPRCAYRGCREMGTMSASLGPACPDHYDALSG